MAVNNQFESFIIKKIVKGVRFNPDTISYSINQLKLTEAELVEVKKEGQKYQLSENEILEIIADISQKIRFTPKIQEQPNIVIPNNIEIGQHLKIYGNDEYFGNASLELLCLEKNRFLVLESDRGALLHDDILVSVTMPWNKLYVIDFKAYRNGKPFPKENMNYRTYRLQKVEFLNPADIYSVIDAETDFSFQVNKE